MRDVGLRDGARCDAGWEDFGECCSVVFGGAWCASLGGMLMLAARGRMGRDRSYVFVASILVLLSRSANGIPRSLVVVSAPPITPSPLFSTRGFFAVWPPSSPLSD
jgi:hypothetical protein